MELTDSEAGNDNNPDIEIDAVESLQDATTWMQNNELLEKVEAVLAAVGSVTEAKEVALAAQENAEAAKAAAETAQVEATKMIITAGAAEVLAIQQQIVLTEATAVQALNAAVAAAQATATLALDAQQAAQLTYLAEPGSVAAAASQQSAALAQEAADEAGQHLETTQTAVERIQTMIHAAAVEDETEAMLAYSVNAVQDAAAYLFNIKHVETINTRLQTLNTNKKAVMTIQSAVNKYLAQAQAAVNLAIQAQEAAQTATTAALDYQQATDTGYYDNWEMIGSLFLGTVAETSTLVSTISEDVGSEEIDTSEDGSASLDEEDSTVDNWELVWQLFNGSILTSSASYSLNSNGRVSGLSPPG